MQTSAALEHVLQLGLHLVLQVPAEFQSHPSTHSAQKTYELDPESTPAAIEPDGFLFKYSLQLSSEYEFEITLISFILNDLLDQHTSTAAVP